jgi:hypothetical protein
VVWTCVGRTARMSRAQDHGARRVWCAATARDSQRACRI